MIKINLINMDLSNGRSDIKPDDICQIAVPAVESLKKVNGNQKRK